MRMSSSLSLTDPLYKHVRNALKKAHDGVLQPNRCSEDAKPVETSNITEMQDTIGDEASLGNRETEKMLFEDNTDHKVIKTTESSATGLKLTLRLKRKSSLSEYEIFKVEGLEETARISYVRRRRRAKYCNLNGGDFVNSDSFCQKPLKRLRLILGNESKTIHLTQC